MLHKKRNHIKNFIPYLFLGILFYGCSPENTSKPDFYENLFTGEVLDPSEFHSVWDSLNTIQFSDTVEEVMVNMHFYPLINSGDSLIRPFKYSIRVGMEYLVRPENTAKIGMNIPEEHFTTLDRKRVQLGGTQAKPALLNLWFVGCTGCVQEMPELNLLKKNFADKVNFIALTFDGQKRVENFLDKTEFNFTHVVNQRSYIDSIATSPYPENIFISKSGQIRYVEGGLVENKTPYFESILQQLIEEPVGFKRESEE